MPLSRTLKIHSRSIFCAETVSLHPNEREFDVTTDRRVGV